MTESHFFYIINLSKVGQFLFHHLDVEKVLFVKTDDSVCITCQQQAQKTLRIGKYGWINTSGTRVGKKNKNDLFFYIFDLVGSK